MNYIVENTPIGGSFKIINADVSLFELKLFLLCFNFHDGIERFMID